MRRHAFVVAQASRALSACADKGPSPAAPAPPAGPATLPDGVRALDGERMLARIAGGDRVAATAFDGRAVERAAAASEPALGRDVMAAFVGDAERVRLARAFDLVSFAP